MMSINVRGYMTTRDILKYKCEEDHIQRIQKHDSFLLRRTGHDNHFMRMYLAILTTNASFLVVLHGSKVVTLLLSQLEEEFSPLLHGCATTFLKF